MNTPVKRQARLDPLRARLRDPVYARAFEEDRRLLISHAEEVLRRTRRRSGLARVGRP